MKTHTQHAKTPFTDISQIPQTAASTVFYTIPCISTCTARHKNKDLYSEIFTTLPDLNISYFIFKIET